jgi:pyruvate carboxylase subunit B
MKAEFTITMDGVTYDVKADGDSITINGRTFVVEVSGEEVFVDGIAYDVALGDKTAIIAGDAHPLEVSGLVLAQAAPPPSRAAAPVVAVSSGAVLAIMPGKIVRVLVEVGQQVEEGQPVCVLEAMKMENELHARQSGTVKAVHVKAGDDVEKDHVLVEIE